MTQDTWLVVANSSLARIFKVQKKDSLVEIETLEHPDSRLHNGDLVTTKPGRAFESAGTTRHALEPSILPKQQEFINFAKEIAHYLEKAYTQGSFKRLYLAASPTQLGLLRQNISPNVMKLISGEVNKDLTHMKPSEIINNLPFLL